MKIEYGSFSALLCSDVSGKGLENILKYSEFLKSELLKVPHHGGSVGQEALTKIFFKEASPQILIISSSPSFSSKAGARADIYSGCAVYNTKDSGAIEVSTDGNGFMARPFLHKN
jgi:competence protein ComEC